MVKKLLKDIKNDNGRTKIDINEIARLSNGEVKLLGELLEWEVGENTNGKFLKHANGLVIVYKNIFIENVERVNFTEALPIKFKDNRVGCFMFASDNSVREVENIKSLVAQVTDNGDAVRIVSALNFKYADNMNSVLMMIGFWK